MGDHGRIVPRHRRASDGARRHASALVTDGWQLSPSGRSERGAVASWHGRRGKSTSRSRPRPRRCTVTTARAPVAPVPHPIEERLEQLAELKEQALPRREPGGGRAPARTGQAHRPGADRAAARPRLLRRARHARPAPGPRLRHREHPPAHRRRRHRLGHHRRPQGLRLRPGLHRLRRRARRGLRREDPQGHGPRRVGRRARSSASTTAPAPASRRASSRSPPTAGSSSAT